MARMLGGVTRNESGRSVSCGAKFYVTESELESFTPDINAPASWAGSGFFISSVSAQKEALGWVVSLTAEPDDTSYTTKSDDRHDLVEKSYRDAEFFFDPAFWGVIRADYEDEENKTLNVNAEKCRRDDFLYRNATADSKGTQDATLSPFTEDTLSLDLLGQRVRTSIYTCKFYSSMAINFFAEFNGVNGTFSAKCRPHTTAARRWRVVGQSLSTEKDRKGNIWTSIERSAMLAPCSFLWSAGKNGGFWDW